MNKACPICGGIPIGNHHIIPRSQNGNNSKINLIELCSHCHDIVEDFTESTGMYYSPKMINIIKLFYDLPKSTAKQANPYYYKNMKVDKLCHTCGSLLQSPKRKFCSSICEGIYYHMQHLKNSPNTTKRYNSKYAKVLSKLMIKDTFGDITKY